MDFFMIAIGVICIFMAVYDFNMNRSIWAWAFIACALVDFTIGFGLL